MSDQLEAMEAVRRHLWKEHEIEPYNATVALLLEQAYLHVAVMLKDERSGKEQTCQ